LHEWAVSTQCGQGSPADSDDAHRRCPSLPCGLLTRFIRPNQHPANGSPSLAPIWPGISELPRCQTPSAVVACRVDAMMSVRYAPLIAAAFHESRLQSGIRKSSAISSRLHPSVHMPACLLLYHQMIRCGRLQSANNNTGRSRACSSSENNRLCQQLEAPQCSTTAGSRPYSLQLKIWSRWCARSSIMLPHTWKDINSPGNSDCLSSNGHRPTSPSIPGILHIGVSRVRVTMSSTLTTRHQLSDMTCWLPNRFAMGSRGFCAVYRAFKSPVRSLVTRLGLVRRLKVNSVTKCERL